MNARELKLDCHVHLVGNGNSGNGCWIRMRGWHRMMGHLMCRTIGMPVGFEHNDFDAIYVSRLRGFVAESSVDHALLLAQDEVYNDDGSKRDFGSFHVPNDYLFSVCAAHPEFLPAISIHPARRDALDELDRCLALGARALKLLPNCHNVDCSAPAHDDFWEKMAAAGLPMLAHTGGEMTVPVANKLYQDPRYLRRPLEIGVKVIAAHAASAQPVGSGLLRRAVGNDGSISESLRRLQRLEHALPQRGARQNPRLQPAGALPPRQRFPGAGGGLVCPPARLDRPPVPPPCRGDFQPDRTRLHA